MSVDMVDVLVLLWSITFIVFHLLQVLRKQVSMSLESSPPPLSWQSITGFVQTTKKRTREVSEPPVSVPSVVKHEAKDCQDEGRGKVSRVVRKRPARIVIPEPSLSLRFGDSGKESVLINEFEVEESEYCLASRKGTRHGMEDGFGVMSNINGDSKQAFFGVFDGHGGRAAVDFVSEKLGTNIAAAIADIEENKEDQVEVAVTKGYLTTDKEFLNQGMSSGACVATVLLKNGDLHVANVGDCRVVMSKKGIASALTIDHRAERDDERARIENSGGYVCCRNGVWRVNDSLAVSRAIGDQNMKEWIISEPETRKICLTPDCEFLILASDGLWDKVSNQEAVDVISRRKNSMQACKDLVEISSSRGSRDDITVMVVDLQRYVW